jgi:uncharacterized protein (TIGR00730 family)
MTEKSSSKPRAAKPAEDERHADQPADEKAESHFGSGPAYLNPVFLKHPEARVLRILAEYMEPAKRFQDLQIKDTIVFFGSARIISRDEAEKDLAALNGAKEIDGEAVERAERRLFMSRYYEDARELSRRLTLWSESLPKKGRRFVVCSGGGPGIMEAANRGAFEAGGKSIGLNIEIPFEQKPNPHITPDLNFDFHYFFMRKFWFAYLAKAMVCMPGGFGTLDEMFEVLTLIQTGKCRRRPVLLFGRDFWSRLINFELLIETGMIAPGDVDLFKFVETAEEAWSALDAEYAFDALPMDGFGDGS